MSYEYFSGDIKSLLESYYGNSQVIPDLEKMTYIRKMIQNGKEILRYVVPIKIPSLAAMPEEERPLARPEQFDILNINPDGNVELISRSQFFLEALEDQLRKHGETNYQIDII